MAALPQCTCPLGHEQWLHALCRFAVARLLLCRNFPASNNIIDLWPCCITFASCPGPGCKAYHLLSTSHAHQPQVCQQPCCHFSVIGRRLQQKGPQQALLQPVMSRPLQHHQQA